MNHVLVTGATGKVGSRLVRKWLQRGDHVRVLARDRARAAELEKLGAEIVIGDLQQRDKMANMVTGMDIIIHLAAFFRGATAEEMNAVNTEGTKLLAEAAMSAGIGRFVFASTNLVYGPGTAEIPFREDSLLPPANSPYPASKIAAEQALQALHRKEGLGLRILRLAFVYGDSDPHLSEGLQWFRQWNPKQPIHLVHHADVTQAFMLAADVSGIDGSVYNVADNEPARAGDILELYGESAAPDAHKRPMSPAWLQLVDTSRIREELGYRPLVPTLQEAARNHLL